MLKWLVSGLMNSVLHGLPIGAALTRFCRRHPAATTPSRGPFPKLAVPFFSLSTSLDCSLNPPISGHGERAEARRHGLPGGGSAGQPCRCSGRRPRPRNRLPLPAPSVLRRAPAASPGPYYHPANVYGGGGGGSGGATFLRRLIIICIGVFLVVGFATFVTWLVLRPRVPAFAVASASVSSFNVSRGSQQLSAEFNLSISVRNPNKKVGIAYDKVDAAVLYGSETISETWLPPFYQEKGDSRVLSARMAAVGQYVIADVAEGIAKERSSNGGAVVFHVRLMGWVRFRSGAWRTRRHLMRVFCDNVKIGFGNANATVGALAGEPQQCGVHI